MGFLLNFLLVVVTSSLLAISYADDEILRHVQFCLARVESCQSTDLQQILRSLETSNVDVDEGCNAVNRVKTCMGDCITTLTGSSEASAALIAALDYICEPSRRQQVQTISNMQCFKRGDFEVQYKREIVQCEEELSNRLTAVYVRLANQPQAIRRAVCAPVNDYISCAAGKMANLCGEELRSFAQDLMMGVMEAATMGHTPECFEQAAVSHSVAKRSVGFLKLLVRK